MKVKAVAGAESNKSSGSDSTKMMQILLYITERKKITKAVSDQRF
jgi:hypothetical protein